MVLTCQQSIEMSKSTKLNHVTSSVTMNPLSEFNSPESSMLKKQEFENCSKVEYKDDDDDHDDDDKEEQEIEEDKESKTLTVRLLIHSSELKKSLVLSNLELHEVLTNTTNFNLPMFQIKLKK